MTGLFTPLTNQALGRGGWGQGQRRQQTEAMSLAEQAQQPQMLQGMVHTRLAAMGEVMRQSQQELKCEIRLDTHTRHAEVTCQPEPMRSAVWGALQGLATPGPVEAVAEPLLACLRWTPFEVLTLPCWPSPTPPDPLDR